MFPTINKTYQMLKHYLLNSSKVITGGCLDCIYDVVGEDVAKGRISEHVISPVIFELVIDFADVFFDFRLGIANAHEDLMMMTIIYRKNTDCLPQNNLTTK